MRETRAMEPRGHTEDDDRHTTRLMKVHLQTLGIPRYSFRHSLQAQTLTVHMRPGAAALVRASVHRGGGGAQQQRQEQSPEPAERSPLLRRHGAIQRQECTSQKKAKKGD